MSTEIEAWLSGRKKTKWIRKYKHQIKMEIIVKVEKLTFKTSEIRGRLIRFERKCEKSFLVKIDTKLKQKTNFNS